MTYPPPPNKLRSDSIPLRAELREGIYSPNGDTVLVEGSKHRSFLNKVEECYSEDHSPEWQNLRGSSYDIGGPFFVFRNLATGFNNKISYYVEVPWSTPKIGYFFQASGNVSHLPLDEMPYPAQLNSSEGQMNMWGAECVAKAAPGKSPIDLSTALGELKKDGIPSVVGTLKGRASVAKKAGDSYLNAQFGWRPLVNDVTSLSKTIAASGSILNQLERDAGRRVRRRLTLVDHTETFESDHLGVRSPSFLGMSSSFFQERYPPSQLRLTVTRTRKVWFSGSFTYYLPKEYYSRDIFVRSAAQARVLLGLNLTPSVLWNLAPWSWAADWFSNAGEVISNTERMLSGGLVMHHGYVMEHTRHIHTYSFDNDCIPPASLMTETKGRVKANPFGFGVDWPDLSGFQLSIAAALGLSRGR